VSLRLQTIINYMTELAPPRLALKDDPVGLQVGDPRDEVSGILVALDMTEDTLQEAVAEGCSLVITHHPLIFRPLKRIDLTMPAGRLIASILKAGVSVFSAHTNLDVASGGVNTALAAALRLSNCRVLQVTGVEELEKIAVFVPKGYEDKVRDALSRAGAGWIGNYSHCSFQTAGTGTFMPREGTQPFIGAQNKLERVEEVRLETIYPSRLRNRVIREVFSAHPYEEPAYDLYPLNNSGQQYGLGLLGEVSEPVALGDVARDFSRLLKASFFRLVGDPQKKVKRVAVCGGSGASLIGRAKAAGADLFVTGDIGYHEARDALEIGLAVLDVGHEASERPVIKAVKDWLALRLQDDGFDNQVLVSRAITSPWSVLG